MDDNDHKTPQTRAYHVRANEQLLVIKRTATVFDKPADMGDYPEYITRSAHNDVNLDDITLLINHNGAGIPLARSPKTPDADHHRREV
ncbi:MAG: hypothetical protein RRY08_04465 [Christensenella sp.]